MRSIPVELEAPAVWSVWPTCSPASLVRALLFVAPNSILPIYDPAMPAARPANSGLRCMNEGCMACGLGIGAVLLALICEVADGFGVTDCSIGFARSGHSA